MAIQYVISPVDHLDSLCKVHDHCYDRALRELGCTKVEVYYLPSLWFVENGRVSVSIIVVFCVVMPQ